MNLPTPPSSAPLGKTLSAPAPDDASMVPHLLSDDERKARINYGIRSPYAEDNPGLTSYNLGRGLAGFMHGPNLMTNTLENGPGTGAALGATAGAALGTAGAGIYNLFADNPVSVSGAGGVSGLLGALLGAYGGQLYSRKQGSAVDYNAVSAAAQQGGYDVGSIQQALLNLSAEDSANLSSMLRGAFGAAAGAIVLQFLLGKGLLTGLGGALLGGYLGASHQPSTIDNYAKFW